MNVYHDATYLEALEYVLDLGEPEMDRTGVGTLSCWGLSMRFDLQVRFPLLTSKKMHFKSVAEELFWFMRGETNVRSLQAKGVTIWDEWADENGNLGPVYGRQWRCFNGVDQLQSILNQLRLKSNSRRLVLSAWNPTDVEIMALPPCHLLCQFKVQGEYLNCAMYQRSCDMFLGVPFNIASYSLLTHILAYMSGLQPGEFVWFGADCHIYSNHVEQVKEQLNRPNIFPSPVLRIKEGAPSDLDSWAMDHLDLIDYQCHPPIRAKVAV